jgi:hypothetical protein
MVLLHSKSPRVLTFEMLLQAGEVVRRFMWEGPAGTVSCSVKSGDIRFHSLSLSAGAAQDSIAVAARMYLSATLSDRHAFFQSLLYGGFT